MNLRERIEERIKELRAGNERDQSILDHPHDAFDEAFAVKRINRRCIMGEELDRLLVEGDQ